MILTKNKKRLKIDCRKPFFYNTVKKLRFPLNTGRKFKNLPVLIFYKEVFDMDEEKIELTEEMTEELSNGREENEND